MRKYLLITIVTLFNSLLICEAEGQRVLTLDSCRAMAMRNNKQLSASRVKSDITANIKRATRTKYLPKVDALGGYEYFSREISLLSSSQKSALSSLGSSLASGASTDISSAITDMAQQGIISPSVAQQLGQMVSQSGSTIAATGDNLGQQLVNALRTDTRNVWVGSIMVRQPLFMGGAITAMNNMADISEQMAANNTDLVRQNTLYTVDQAYWTVLSLVEKQKLAYSYRDLVQKFDDDVQKMIREGVATRADGLKVDVKVNEANMQVVQVDDGLSLAKMLLCKLIGLPMDSDIAVTEEDATALTMIDSTAVKINVDDVQRPELRLLANAVDLSEQATKLVRAQYMPHAFLTGGYMISNPNVFDSFNRHFKGVWNVGITLHVPVWNWFEGAYKIRAGKSATTLAELELSDAKDMIALQVSQCQYKLNVAYKKLTMTIKNLDSANENLRCANVGFREGVMETTDVMAAQTAWQQAQSQKIDAEIELRLASVGLKKALGEL